MASTRIRLLPWNPEILMNRFCATLADKALPEAISAARDQALN